MQDISALSQSAKEEIAGYIRDENFAYVNERVEKPHVRDSFYTRYGKRLIDIIVSLAAVIVTAPINAIIAVITFFDVGRPILFKQIRIGRGEKPFVIYKFRNMTEERDGNGELLPASERVTKWGKFVRRTSLDELLNFVSILNGSMSLIGPRPLKDYYVERLNIRHKAIYAIRPGLECPSLQKMDHAPDWQERLDNYVWYAENCSLGVDLSLMFRVISMAFDRETSRQRSSAKTGGLLGYDRDLQIIGSRSVPDRYVERYCKAHGYKDLQDAIRQRNGGEHS